MEGFEIRTVNNKGKGLFATKRFEEGDVILEESPIVSCQFAWNLAYKYLACDFCMKNWRNSKLSDADDGAAKKHKD